MADNGQTPYLHLSHGPDAGENRNWDLLDQRLLSLAQGLIDGIPAGGDLSGTYPSPSLRPGAVTRAQTAPDLWLSPIPTSADAGKVLMVSAGPVVAWSAVPGGPPSGAAGGDLTGNYPAPELRALAVGTAELADLAVTTAKVNDLAVTTGKLQAGAVTDAKVTDLAATKLTGTLPQARLPTAPTGLLTANLNDAQVTRAKAAADCWLSPVPVGGDVGKVLQVMAGPTLSWQTPGAASIPDGSITTVKLADAPNSVTTAKISDGAVTNVKLATGIDAAKVTVGILPVAQLPDHDAAKVTTGIFALARIPAIDITRLPDAPAGITTAKLNDAQVTDAKIAGMAYAKLTGAPTALPPSGSATGDLGGSYPAPTVAKLNGALLGTTTPLVRGDILVANATPALARLGIGANANVLQSNGTDIVWAAAPGGPPSGAATGSLTGTYPAPTIAASAVRGTPSAGGTAREIAKASIWAADDVIDLSISTTKLAALAVTDAKVNDLAATKLTGTIAQARLPISPSGLLAANLNDAQVTRVKAATDLWLSPVPAGADVGKVLTVTAGPVLAWQVPAGGSPTGTASGSLAGTYPGPTIAQSAIRGTPSSGGVAREIAKASIWAGDDLIDLSIPTTKLANTAVTDAKINDVAATKLSGTIAQARFPVAPSGLLTTNLNDLQVTTAKLADGAVTFVKRGETAHALVKRTTGQSIPHNTSTAFIFDTIVVNVGGMYSAGTPDRFTIATTGLYLVGGTAWIPAVAGGTGRYVIISVGTLGAWETGDGVAPSGVNTVSVTLLCQLTAGNVVFLVAYHDQGAAITYNAGNYFWIVRVG